MAKDYEVGYGRPPAQHRFKPGNQAARKRKGKSKPQDVSCGKIVEDVLRTRRRVKRGDDVVSLTVAQILRERLIQLIMSGSARDVTTVIQFIERYLPQRSSNEPEPLELHLYRAEGSKVALPPTDLWSGEGG